MKTNIIKPIGRYVNKVGFKLKKHSPEILVVAGIFGVIGSTVMACKATTKLSGILDDAKDKVDKIHDCADGKIITTEEYTQEDANKDLAITYVQTGLKLVKLYAPAVAIGALSLTGIIASNNILRKRNVALAAAYATVDKGFKEYRHRVIERFGERVDHELKYNIKAQEIEEKTTDAKGKEKVVNKTVDFADPNTYSDYARWFDESNPNWEKNAEYNLMFLKMQQNYANDLLRANKRLFLNEVYQMLGIPKTKAGQVVGWVYDVENPVGDNFVDFGIYDENRQVVRDFVNGYERCILLDFNVDGNIWDML